MASYMSLKIPEKQPLLHTLVVGESLMNDAVAITLWGVLNHATAASFGSVTLEMLAQFFGSIALGSVTAAVLVLLMRAAHLPGRTKAQTLYIGIAGYIVFTLADTLNFSGIIAGLFGGIVFRRYGGQHFSDEGENRATDTFEVVSHLMETGVFVMCGISTALLKNLHGFYFGICGVVLCLVSRVLVVFVCAGACNILKQLSDDRPSIITAGHQSMMTLGCLRGGIALVLALEIGEWMPNSTKSVLIEGVFIVIVTLLLLCGGTTEVALEALGFVSLQDEEEHERRDFPAHEQFPHSPMNTSLLDDKNPERFARRMGCCMDDWLSDLLVGDPQEARGHAEKVDAISRRSTTSRRSLSDIGSPQGGSNGASAGGFTLAP
jgi:NhaP-type Na+/H+ or K+/H+ antiporter